MSSGHPKIRDVPGQVPADVEALLAEMRGARPGYESERMRLLLSRVTLDNGFQFQGLCDVEGNLWEANHTALVGAGVVRSDLHGKPFWQARWWQSSEAAQRQLEAGIRRAAQGEFVRYDAVIYGGEAGTQTIVIDFSIRPALDSRGQTRFLVVEGRDVTEQRRLERAVAEQRAQLAEAVARLEELDRLKSQMFANVSHEFRTPLTLILGPLDDALRDASKPLTGEALESVHRNALRLLRLVNTVLEFSRIDAERVVAAPEATDLPALTAGLAASFQSLVASAGLALEIDCPRFASAVYVDRQHWEKIVLNLLSNAFKFTLAGTITVRLRELDDRIVLTVADTGTGIPERELSRIFERFHRVEGAVGRSFEGTGIGLALVRELAVLHGGAVQVESKLGVGSAFTVSIPKQTARAAGEGAARQPSSQVVSYVSEASVWSPPERTQREVDARVVTPTQVVDERRARLLVADDNADMRDYLTGLLTPRWSVTAVEDGQTALEVALAHPPDLILSDVMMPRMDGLGLLKALRDNPQTKTIPFVLLSARAGEEAVVGAVETGADDYVVKPFSALELVARIQTHLEMARARSEWRSELQRSHEQIEQLAAIVDSSEDAIIGETLAGEVTSWNASAQRMFGYEASEMLGASLAKLVPDHTQRSAMLQAIARGEKVDAYESQWRHKDGSWIDVSVRLSPVLQRGRVVGAAQVVRDISARKQMEAATRRANADLVSAVESIDDGFVLYDERDRVVLVNSAFRRMFDAERRDPLAGQTFAHVLNSCCGSMQLADGSGDDVRTKLMEYHRATVGTVELRTSAGRIVRLCEQRTPEGGTVALYVDITAEAGRERELRVARAQAEAASASKSEFLASMSHELRTPLNAILGFTELIQRDRTEPLSARQRERLAHVRHGGEHLLCLIDDILDLSRIEAGRLMIANERVDVVSVVGQVVSQLGPIATRHGVMLQFIEAGGGDSVVLADRTRLSQVLMNFGSNALKYGRPGGYARYRITRPSTARIRIAVVDDGVGIPLDKQDKLFEPFQRAGQEAGPIEGTGIGLAISKRLAEMMGASIGFKSAPGTGTEFWIELDELTATRARGASLRPALRAAPLSRALRAYRVVYVEDNASNVALIASMVQDLPRVELSVAPTAEAGLALIRKVRPDLVLMDINLPGMSGIDAKRLLADDPELRAIPVVALSASALPADKARAHAAGFIRYLTKPLSIEVLVNTLEELLGGAP